jgi:hypothetical protein
MTLFGNKTILSKFVLLKNWFLAGEAVSGFCREFSVLLFLNPW